MARREATIPDLPDKGPVDTVMALSDWSTLTGFFDSTGLPIPMVTEDGGVSLLASKA
jgi:hypothetical protein